MADPCRLRPVSPADLPSLAALERQAFSDPWSEEQLRTVLGWAGAVAFLAEGDDGVAGYVLGRVIVDQSEILSIATMGARRRQGVGRRLLAAAMAAMCDRGARTAWLEVRASNNAALAMYQTAGFVSAGVRRDYYRQPVEDALVLRCELSPVASAGPGVR